MEPNKKQPQSDQRNNDPEEFIDEVTRKKIDLHLHDINDNITEEDIKKVITDISSPEIADEDKQYNEEEPLSRDKTTDKKDNNDQLPTTWNVLE